MIECRNAKGILLADGSVLFAGGVVDGSLVAIRGGANSEDNTLPADNAEVYYPPAESR
jgi:hypothetical protein